MATFHITTAPIDEIEADLVMLVVPENPGPLIGASGLADWRMSGKISSLIREKRCTGAEGDRLLVLNVPKLASTSAELAGVGSLRGLGAEAAADRLIAALIPAKKAGADTIAVAADYLVGEGRPFASVGALQGALTQRSREQSKMLPSDVTLTTLDLNLF